MKDYLSDLLTLAFYIIILNTIGAPSWAAVGISIIILNLKDLKHVKSP